MTGVDAWVRDRRAVVIDAAWAVAVLGLGSWRETTVSNAHLTLIDAPLGVYLAVHVVAAVALLLRRRDPLLAAVVIAAVSIVTPTYAVLVIPYSVVLSVSLRWRGAVVLAALAAVWVLGTNPLAGGDPSGLAIMAVAAVLGLYVRARRRLLAELAEQARADERIRLAGEMHDVVSHQVTLMVLQAGALSVSTTDDEVRQAAESLRRTGRQALDELRELIGVLRTGHEPVLDLDESGGDLRALIAASRAAGVDVRLDRTGDPAVSAASASTAASPSAVRHTVYRVVQESLTNAAKHAPGANVTVTVREEAEQVHVRIADTGTAAQPPEKSSAPDPTSGPGTGLDGLRRRVELTGGTFRAGPSPRGGFVVEAELPAGAPGAAGKRASQ